MFILQKFCTLNKCIWKRVFCQKCIQTKITFKKIVGTTLLFLMDSKNFRYGSVSTARIPFLLSEVRVIDLQWLLLLLLLCCIYQYRYHLFIVGLDLTRFLAWKEDFEDVRYFNCQPGFHSLGLFFKINEKPSKKFYRKLSFAFLYRIQAIFGYINLDRSHYN